MGFRYEVLVMAGAQLDLRQDLRDLPVVTIEATSKDAITGLGLSAQNEFGANWTWRYHQFVTIPDTEGRRYQAPFTVYPDQDGVLLWRKHGLADVTVGDVERAAAEGLFEG